MTTEPLTLLTSADVVCRIGVSLSSLERIIREGQFPKYARIGQIRVWRNTDVEHWMDEQFNDPKEAA